MSTSREAELASGTAENIQHIFAVTEQTGEGTKSTVQQVRELTRIADELRQSVSRFRIACQPCPTRLRRSPITGWTPPM